MDARAFLRSKREGQEHAPEELRAFVAAFAAGAIPDYQVSAWLMAAYLNGLSEAETAALTEALIHSGRVFDWSALGRPSADKHSTGGVGDKVSLIVVPLAAACGVVVPKMSGRGLGHSGGTLDKLESIPGFRVGLTVEELHTALRGIGCVLMGQTARIAPADKLIYALRDVTATVERDYFIVPSIVSKKVAEGAGALVYDVKCGNGAFMSTRADAAGLARRLVATTRALGRRAAALVTDMSQPLGAACGNALEVAEAVEVLKGGGPADVRALTLELAAAMLALAGTEPTTEAGRARALATLAGGAAHERFLALVAAQGGDAGRLSRGLPRAPELLEARAARAGRLAAVDTRGLGERIVAIGGGRRAQEDAVDPRVGLMVRRRLGDVVAAGDVLAEVHLATADPAEAQRVAACFTIADAAPAAPGLVIERIEWPRARSGS